MTDAAFLLSILEDGEEHSQAELLRRSFEQRGCGLTVHSRIADLRNKGHFIVCRRVQGKSRGDGWLYQLLLSASPQSDPRPSSSSMDRLHDRREGGRGDALSEQESLFETQSRPAWA